MYIILIAWGFVVSLMAAAEAMSTTIISGLLTLAFYGLLPMAILLYLMQTPVRRKRRAREENDALIKLPDEASVEASVKSSENSAASGKPGLAASDP